MELAILGCGRMGSAMIGRLMDAGHRLWIYNRSPQKTKSLAKRGAVVCEKPGRAVASAEGILLVLSDAAAIESVLFPNAEPPPNVKGRMIIQMGTIGPSESCSLMKRIEAVGGRYLEAPVLGSTPEAATGRLMVMVGGRREDFDAWSTLFGHLSPEPLYIGPVGQAASLKLALNQLIAALTAAYSMSLGIVRRRGIDPALFATILRKGPLFAPQFDKKLDKMLTRNFVDAHFSARHLLKDVRLVRWEAEELGLGTDMVAALAQVLEKTLAGGWAEDDYSALYNALDPPEDASTGRGRTGN